ncbi:MAG: PQQ-dependent sugar dehydrogenase [Caldimonas sp.]
MKVSRWIEALAGTLLCALLAACGGEREGQAQAPAVAGPGNRAPVPVILSPGVGATFQAGDTLEFSGSASDAEDGTLAPAQLSWWVESFHEGRAHAAQAPTAGRSGTYAIPVRGETSDDLMIRLHLRATDRAGVSSEVSVDLLPRRAKVSIATSPPGLPLTLDGQPAAAPGTFVAVVGTERDLGAADLVFNGRRYRFDAWSDGGTASHTISVPGADTTYVATFTDIGRAGATILSNQPPLPVIGSPGAGLTFKAGDVIDFAASASDPEDGVLPTSQLTWWVELQHDSHTHPVLPPTAGASGQVTIPVRGETSDNILYRFHLRATDSQGLSAEVTRDVLPRKATVTLTTLPAGLPLTLDGQPDVSPITFLGVVGIERDLGASDVIVGGRRYRFDSWSDAGAVFHTISTPATDTTFTASFTDVGPAVNALPSVSLAPVGRTIVDVPVNLRATASDSDGSVVQVAFFDGATLIGNLNSPPYTIAWTPLTSGSHSLSARATDNNGAQTTSTRLSVTVKPAGPDDLQPPVVTLTSPLNLADGLTGTLILSATATDNVGVAGVEFQIDGEIIGAEKKVAPYGGMADTGRYTAGQHVVRARARDAAGNLSPWDSALVRFAGTRTVPVGFTMNESWVTGLNNAIAFAVAPDGRLFITEQAGTVRVVKNGVLLATPFHTLSVDSRGERGALGIALHPDFANNGFVYVLNTTLVGGAHNRVTRLVASGDVSTGAEQSIVDLPALSESTSHNGGAIHFGFNGKLYLTVGDNSEGLDAQNFNVVFGKMLRFNDDGSIPPENPFAGPGGLTGLARAIWVVGLRNPFTFAIQPGTGRMHINDVGQTSWEEINLGKKASNYGWPYLEGPSNIGGAASPLFSYAHEQTVPPGSGTGGFIIGKAIAGGAFYPTSGGNFPAAHRGSYFFGDFAHRTISRMDLANHNAVYSFALLGSYVTDLVVGPDGALHALTRSGVARIAVR